MAGSSLIGNLAVNLSMETAAFRKGATLAEKQAHQLGKRLQSIGDGMGDLGRKMALGITAPLVGIAVAGVKMAADFETAMNAVGISTQATTSQLKQMNELALTIGATTTKSASEAAEAMDMLAKAGMSVNDILNGGARAAVALAEAAGSELDPAAAAITDTMSQFKKTTADLPGIINNITGAVNESKFDFTDFQLGMSQAGGVAASAGVEFEDFTATLAATASQFASGSDAGTSFKTFLLRMVPDTKKAREAMEQYGVSFYDASGQMKSMADVAQMLQDKFAGMSEMERTAIFKTMFGTDAIRTAIGLMKAGGDGIEEMQRRIAATKAADQAAKRMKGFNAQLEQLGGALETLAIRIAQSGILEMLTGFVRSATDFIGRLSAASPTALKLAVALAAVAAAVGPLLMIFGPIVSLVGKAIPLIVALSGSFATAATAAGGLAPLLAGLAPILLPIAAALGAAYLAWKNWDTIGPMVSELWSTIQRSLGPPLLAMFEDVRRALTELWNGPFGQGLKAAISLWFEFQVAMTKVLGPVALALLRGFIVVLSEVFESMGLALNLVASLLKGDFGGAWEYARRLAANAVTAIGRVIEAMVPGAIDSLRRLYEGAKAWLVDRFWDLVRLVTAPIRAIAASFAWLYDKVVGHSYIPDMVDQIGAHMRRLEVEMAEPARKAAAKTAEHFRNLQALLAELYPEAEAHNQYLAKLATLKRGLDDGRLSAEQYADALEKLQTKGMDSTFDEELSKYLNGNVWDEETLESPVTDIDELLRRLPEIPKLAKRSTGETALAFAQMAESITYSLQNLSQAFKGGGFWDKVLGVLGVVQAGVEAYLGFKGGGGGTSYLNRANGGSVISGRTYMVGERGPERFTPSRSGRIIANNDNHSSDRLTKVIVDTSPLLTARIVEGDARAMLGGSAEAQRNIARRQARRIP